MVLTAIVMALTGASCREQRTEYHKRPAFYEKASMQKLENEVVLEDGTIIKYNADRGGTDDRPGDPQGKQFQIRQEHEDGTVTLSAMLPEHVLANTLTCVRNEEYQLLYEQLLAERTKLADEEAGQGAEEFISFFRKNRHELTATLTRMVAGIPAQEVKFGEMGDGVTRCRLRPQIAEPFKFKTVDVVNEGGRLKLLMIR